MNRYLIVKYTVQLLTLRVALRMMEASLQHQIDDLKSGEVGYFQAINLHLQEFMRIRRIFHRFEVLSVIGHYFARF